MGMQRVGHDEWLSLQYPLLYFSNLGRSNLSYYLNSLLDLGRVVDFQFFSIFYLIAGHSNDFQAPYMLEWTLYTCSSFFPQLWLSKKRVDALTWRWCHHLSKKAHTGPRKRRGFKLHRAWKKRQVESHRLRYEAGNVRILKIKSRSSIGTTWDSSFRV